MFVFWVITLCRTVCFSALDLLQVRSTFIAVRTTSVEFVLHAGYLKYTTQTEELISGRIYVIKFVILPVHFSIHHEY